MASGYVNVSKTVFPPMSDLDFASNCTSYGRWLATMVEPHPWQSNENDGGGVSVAAEFMVSALPSDWVHPDAGDVTPPQLMGQLMQWYSEQLYMGYDEGSQQWYSNPDFILRAVDVPSEKCPVEFCKAIGRTSNTDVAGIGVQVSYYVEAILATLYLVAFTVWQLREHNQKKRVYKSAASGTTYVQRAYTGPAGGISGRILDAFRATLNAFLSSAMLFSLVMLVAAVKIAVQKVRFHRLGTMDRDIPTGSALYDICLSLLAATFSVFPVMLIYALMRHSGNDKEEGHRQWMRRAVLMLMWALGVTEMFLAPRGELDYEDRHNKHSEYACDKRGGAKYWQGLKTGQVLVIGAPVLWILLTLFVVTGFWIPGLADRPWVKRWRSIWRLLVAWINLLMMWAVLGYFTYLRHGIRVLSGGLDQADKWTFGQILALATWAPLAGDFLYTLIFGLGEGLSTHLPEGYEAVRRPDAPGAPGYYPSKNGGASGEDGVPLVQGAAGMASHPQSHTQVQVVGASPSVVTPGPPPYQNPAAAATYWGAMANTSYQPLQEQAMSPPVQQPQPVSPPVHPMSPPMQQQVYQQAQGWPPQQQQQQYTRQSGNSAWDQWENTGWGR